MFILTHFNKLIFRIHAIQRMFQRRISREDVRRILKTGEVLEEYPNDTPYPSRLVLGFIGTKPLHIVVADNNKDKETIVITAYEPSQKEWLSGFKKRRR